MLSKRDRKDKLKALEAAYPNIARSEGKAHLVVIHETGLIAAKKAEDFFIPVGGQVVRLSFPVIRANSSPSSRGTGITINGQYTEAPDFIQNMDSIASQTLEDRRLRLLLKQGARLLLRVRSQSRRDKNLALLEALQQTSLRRLQKLQTRVGGLSFRVNSTFLFTR